MLVLANTIIWLANTVSRPFQHIGRILWTPALTEASLSIPVSSCSAIACTYSGMPFIYMPANLFPKGEVPRKRRPFLALSPGSSLTMPMQLQTNLRYKRRQSRTKRLRYLNTLRFSSLFPLPTKLSIAYASRTQSLTTLQALAALRELSLLC